MNAYIITFSLLNGISEINQLFDDILIIWPAPVYIYIYIHTTTYIHTKIYTKLTIIIINNICIYIYIYIYTTLKEWQLHIDIKMHTVICGI